MWRTENVGQKIDKHTRARTLLLHVKWKLVRIVYQVEIEGNNEFAQGNIRKRATSINTKYFSKDTRDAIFSRTKYRETLKKRENPTNKEKLEQT